MDLIKVTPCLAISGVPHDILLYNSPVLEPPGVLWYFLGRKKSLEPWDYRKVQKDLVRNLSLPILVSPPWTATLGTMSTDGMVSPKQIAVILTYINCLITHTNFRKNSLSLSIWFWKVHFCRHNFCSSPKTKFNFPLAIWFFVLPWSILKMNDNRVVLLHPG